MDNPPTPSFSSQLLRIAHPWMLLAGVLFYALGGGIAHYLGISLNWGVYSVGQVCILLLQLSGYFLEEYFSLPPFAASIKGQPALLTRPNILAVAATFLTIGAALTVLLLAQRVLNPAAFLILGLAFLLAMVYALPPVRLGSLGYGELAVSILLANLAPALAFLLQAGELHRLLALITFPLTLLFLAFFLAVSLQSYAADMKVDRKTMLTRLGWQRGMSIHNLLILAGFLVMGFASVMGLPWGLTWPGLLGLPVGIFQIWQMSSISNGAKPRWRLLAITAAATLALTAYFLNLALWTG